MTQSDTSAHNNKIKYHIHSFSAAIWQLLAKDQQAENMTSND